jgi:periplasmic divalent cation tolerance protein
MEDDVVILLCTAPSADVAGALAQQAVEARLAACVNIIEGVRSVYVWDGAVCDEREAQLLFKTTRRSAPALSALLTEQHPYDVPELLLLPVDQALSSPAYLRFVRDGLV